MAFPANYNLYDEVTIDKDKVSGSSDHSNFPAYIDLPDMSAQFWANVSNGGGDIRVTLDDGTTQLPREVVSCDISGKTGELHVNVSTLQYDTDTVIRVWYNGTDTEPAADSTYGSQNTWNSNYKAVYHMNDASGGITDSTANGNDGTQGGTPTYEQTGKVGSAIDLDGSSDYFDLSAISYNSNPVSIQIWAKSGKTNYTSTAGLIGARSGGDLNRIRVEPSSDVWDAYFNGVDSSGSSVDTNWIKLDSTYDGSTLTLYENGSPANTDTGSVSLSNSDWVIGREEIDVSNEYFQGLVDEARVYAGTLSADWIATEYANQNSPDTFYGVIAKSKKQGFSKAYIF